MLGLMLGAIVAVGYVVGSGLKQTREKLDEIINIMKLK
jgi:hypothetical protein